MAKTVAILFLAACFFFKDAASLFVSHEYQIFSVEDPAKTDSSDSKEKDGEEKGDEYKIGLKAEQFLYNTGCKKKFYHAHELNYRQHCIEVNSPPPDFI